MNKIADIFMGLIFVAGITTVVAHPDSAKLVTAGGKTFVDSLRAAQGK